MQIIFIYIGCLRFIIFIIVIHVHDLICFNSICILKVLQIQKKPYTSSKWFLRNNLDNDAALITY